MGVPAVFVRTSGCNLNCLWCDTDHSDYKELAPKTIANKIQYDSTSIFTVIFTGGEPMLEFEEIKQVIEEIRAWDLDYRFHLESNGTILNTELIVYFDYICFSPKNVETIRNIHKFVRKYRIEKKIEYDIKVVSNGEFDDNKPLLYGATMLMPLTTFDEKKDLEIKQKVWDLCVKYGKRYSPRLQIDLFGNKKGV